MLYNPSDEVVNLKEWIGGLVDQMPIQASVIAGNLYGLVELLEEVPKAILLLLELLIANLATWEIKTVTMIDAPGQGMRLETPPPDVISGGE